MDAEAVGGIGLVPGADVHAKQAHIGYWLGEPLWGRGIMTAGQLIDSVLYARLADRPLPKEPAPV
ncbi:MAG: GNAT family N-acetyltransferase [Pseudomonadota bacterium]|nr:GNAT family N-acetyltransferase [Pseudomonadota bacterium]